MTLRFAPVLLLSLPCLLSLEATAGAEDAAPSRAAAMAKSATAWLATLSPAQLKKAQLPFGHVARRRWQATPGRRVGLAQGEMRKDQRVAARVLLRTGLSEAGLEKFQDIVVLEAELRARLSASYRARNPSWRDPGLYWIAVFGRPTESGTWSWRIEGHHYSRHFTCVRGRVSATPGFQGANPARVTRGPRQGLRALAAEEEAARSLLASLSAAERTRALTRTAPRDFLPSTPRDLSRIPVDGLPAGVMTAPQRKLLWALIDVWVGALHPDLASATRAEMKAEKPEEIRFTWIGRTQRGQPHGYRVRGPTFFFEYWHAGNHIHSVWRDPRNEYGLADLARLERRPR